MGLVETNGRAGMTSFVDLVYPVSEAPQRELQLLLLLTCYTLYTMCVSICILELFFKHSDFNGHINYNFLVDVFNHIIIFVRLKLDFLTY